MAKKKRFVDPFFPNRPVDDPQRFEGRESKVEEIIDSLYQSAHGNPVHTIITGERGIGKSSLLSQAFLLSRGDNRLAEKFQIDTGVEKFDFVSVWVDAVKDQTLENLVERIFSELASSILKFVKGFKLELEWFIKIKEKDPKDKSISDLVDAFIRQIEKVYEKDVLKNDKQGIIIFIDEFDRLEPDSGIASFLKLTCEKLSRVGLKQVIFFAAGIKGAVQKFEEEHASVLRTLRDIPLDRFEYDESKEILTSGFERVKHEFDDNIFMPAYKVSAGFPEPLHLIGSEILAVDTDYKLDMADYELAKNKIISDVRKNSLESKLKSAGLKRNQDILEVMANYPEKEVPLAYISEQLDIKPVKFKLELEGLMDKEIIYLVMNGIYSFVDPLLKEYIKEFGKLEY